VSFNGSTSTATVENLSPCLLFPLSFFLDSGLTLSTISTLPASPANVRFVSFPVERFSSLLALSFHFSIT
jgi:hypothetical protein